MDNRFFNNNMLDILLNQDRWRVVSSWFKPEHEPSPELPGRDVTMHKHAHKEILIVIDGQGEYCVLGRMYPCNAGSIFLMDSFEEHQINYPEMFPDADHLWIFVFEGRVMFRLIRICNGSAALSGLWTHIIPVEHTGITSNSCIFGNSPASNLPNDYKRLEGYTGLSALISAIVREGYSLPPDEDSSSLQKKVISTIRSHIYETAGKGASLDTLARMSGYSKFHFLRLFNQHTGMSLRHYIDFCRLEKVAEMQKEGCYKKEIASALGFSSLSAFSRWYKSAKK